MPAPRKLDLIPPEFVDWLRTALAARGFGDIVAVTEELNDKLAEAGSEITIGKSAVGDFNKALKVQREAFGLAEKLLAEIDVGQEADMHRALVQMIAAEALQLIRAARTENEQLSADALMKLGKTIQSLMSSAQVREKILEGERRRIAEEAAAAARAEAEAEMAERFEEVVADTASGLSAEQAARIRNDVLGVRS